MLWGHLDFMRGVEAFLNCVSPASMQAMIVGLASLGLDGCNKAVIADDLLDSNGLFLTGNTDTVCTAVLLDLDRDGPTVVEIPPGCGPGTIIDTWFRFVVDTGAPGPDRGAGGRCVILRDDDDTTVVPDDVFVARSPSQANFLVVRGFLVDGKPDAATEMFRNGLKAYLLADADNPPEMEFISLSGKEFNTIHSNDATFFNEINELIQREPIGVIDHETRGLLASVRFEKGKAFAPDDRMQEILSEAAAVANGTARAIDFRPRDPEALIYEDRKWITAFVGGDYRWLRRDGEGGRNLDARTLFFYFATVNTPAMALKMVGFGSQYAAAMTDADGEPLDGSVNYRLHLPAGIPAKDFWSIVIYDPQTRSELQTGQRYPSLNNARDQLQYNDNGSLLRSRGAC